MRTHGETLVTAARNACLKYHAGQFRADGTTPYYTHCFAVEEEFLKHAKGLSEYDIFRGRALCLTHDILEMCPKVTEQMLSDDGLESLLLDLRLVSCHDGDSYLAYLLVIKRTKDEVLIRFKVADGTVNTRELPLHPSAGARRGLKTKYELSAYILLN
jgi:hypothetical protein